MSYSDPFVPRISDSGLVLDAIDPDKVWNSGIDCAVIATDHSGFDYESIAQQAPIVVDTRNALKGVKRDNIFRL